jgi:hypothetical protein
MTYYFEYIYNRYYIFWIDQYGNKYGGYESKKTIQEAREYIQHLQVMEG